MILALAYMVALALFLSFVHSSASQISVFRLLGVGFRNHLLAGNNEICQWRKPKSQKRDVDQPIMRAANRGRFGTTTFS